MILDEELRRIAQMETKVKVNDIKNVLLRLSQEANALKESSFQKRLDANNSIFEIGDVCSLFKEYWDENGEGNYSGLWAIYLQRISKTDEIYKIKGIFYEQKTNNAKLKVPVFSLPVRAAYLGVFDIVTMTIFQNKMRLGEKALISIKSTCKEFSDNRDFKFNYHGNISLYDDLRQYDVQGLTPFLQRS